MTLFLLSPYRDYKLIGSESKARLMNALRITWNMEHKCKTLEGSIKRKYEKLPRYQQNIASTCDSLNSREPLKIFSSKNEQSNSPVVLKKYLSLQHLEDSHPGVPTPGKRQHMLPAVSLYPAEHGYLSCRHNRGLNSATYNLSNLQ